MAVVYSISSRIFMFMGKQQYNKYRKRMFFFFFFLDLGFDLSQDYFTLFEPSQSLGGSKTGDPREKPHDHPQAELGLSHM